MVKNDGKHKRYRVKEPIISKLSEIDFSNTYSYKDYLKWQIEERLELIRGQIFEMSAPCRLHQEVSMHIFYPLYNFLKGQQCKVYYAPFDVRLPGKSKNDDAVFTVVQPDICVICDPHKLDLKGCIGAPDIMVEILSSGNSKKEMRSKFEVYQDSKVKEYWVVFPEEKLIYQYLLDNEGRYQATLPLVTGDLLTTPILPGFSLSLEDTFLN